MQFIGANSRAILKGEEEQAAKSNYFIGSDPTKWRTNIANYAKLVTEELYPGIDAVFYGNGRELEFDLCVGPGKNPNNVRLHFEGAQELSIDQEGHLHIALDNEQKVQMKKPFVYQLCPLSRILRFACVKQS